MQKTASYVRGIRPPSEVVQERQMFGNAQAAIGGGAHTRPMRHGSGQHYIHMLTMAAPLIIGEIIHDSQKRWRWIRICSLVGAIASEAVYQQEKSEAAR